MDRPSPLSLIDRSPAIRCRRGITAALSMALVLVAWAGGRPAATAADSPTGGRIHITYWEKWVGPEAKAVRAMVDAFNRSQDRIVVECITVSPIDRKTLVSTAGGDPPDVSGLYGHNLSSFADAEALMPFDEFIRRDGLTPEQWLARYYPVYAKLIQHNGRIYAGISTPAMITLHWNKTLFREAGLDPERPPRTVEELDAFARKLTKRDPRTGDITQMGFLPQEPGWWPWVFCRWFGGQLYDEKSRTITLATDPRNLAAMQWVAGYGREYGAEAVAKFASGFAGQMNSPESGFFSGKVAMVFQGVWFNDYIREYKPGLDYGAASAWPSAAPGISDFGLAEADILVIPRGAKHPEAAWEFIKYVNTNNPRAERREDLAGVELLCYLQAKNSPLREWSPFFANHHPHPHIAAFRQLSASPNAECGTDIGIWTEYQREILNAFSRIRLLMETPEEALAHAQRRLERSWARHLLSLQRHGQVPPVKGAAAP